MKKIIYLIIALLVFSSSTGCGDSALTLTKAEFAEKANAICRRGSKEVQDKFAELVQSEAPKSKAKAAALKLVNDVMIVANQKKIDEIATLEVPKDDEHQVDAILAAMQKGIDTAKKEPLRFLRTESSLRRAHKMAETYGLSAC
jgi:hypothetical protein